MIIKENMCYSLLMRMLLDTPAITQCIRNIEFTPPDLSSEGFNGYMSTDVTITVDDLVKYAALREKALNLISGNSVFYHEIKNGNDELWPK